MLSNIGFVPKGWGWEDIGYSSNQFCIKKLIFNRANAKCSLHYHINKYEEWKVIQGRFRIEWADSQGNLIEIKDYTVGDEICVPTMLAHRIIGLEDMNVLLEVSTADHIEDSYRLKPGDSQK